MSEIKTLNSLIKSAETVELDGIQNILLSDANGEIKKAKRQRLSLSVLTVNDSYVMDANECTHYGFMRTNQDTLNIPVQIFGFLLNLRYDEVATIQIWLNWHGLEMHMRRRNSGGSNSGTWSEWKKFAFV